MPEQVRGERRGEKKKKRWRGSREGGREMKRMWLLY